MNKNSEPSKSQIYEAQDLTNEIISAKPNNEFSVTKCLYGTIAIRPSDFGLSNKEAVPGVFLTTGFESKKDPLNKGTISLICFIDDNKENFVLSPNDPYLHGSKPEESFKAILDEASKKLHPEVFDYNPLHPENRYGLYREDVFPVNIEDEKLLKSLFFGHIATLDKSGSAIIGADVQDLRIAHQDKICINEPSVKKPMAVIESLIGQLKNDIKAITEGSVTPSLTLHNPIPDEYNWLPWIKHD